MPSLSGSQLSTTMFHVLTLHAITLALEVMILSSSPNIKLAFNSLCAYASVNHLHWHLYYQPTSLAVQTLPLSSCPGTPFFTFTDQAYPALGWVWLLNTEVMDNLGKVAGEVAKLTNWLTEKEVAHNVVMTKGSGAEGGWGGGQANQLVDREGSGTQCSNDKRIRG